ncbi:MAG TPA: cation acetate symporter [Verrucomicrobiae bacterium]|nr:cation acetate symporter [Verrucomicrobiae bacterium]
MQIDPYILAFSAITVIATIWMGFRSAKTSKTASDFFVAGRSVSVGWNASAISGEYLSAASFMGVAGMVMSSGYDALWYPVCYACGYLFLLLFIAGPLRRFGAYTIPDFAEGRYDSPMFRKIAVCFVLFIGFFYTMPQMKGAGVTLAYIFPGLPYWVGVLLVGAVITLNVALGGMKGITLVQAFQYWMKMFAISVPIFVLMAVYGHYGKQLEVNGNVQHPTFNIQLSTNASNAELIQKLQTAQRVGEAGRSAARKELSFKQATDFQAIQNTAKSYGMEFALKNALGTEYREVRHMASGDPASVFVALSWLGEFGEILWVDSWTNFPVKLPASAKNMGGGLITVPRDEAVRAALDALEASGAGLIPAGTNRCLVVKKSEAAAYEAAMRQLGWISPDAQLREPLPEKAPKDETWLSPFGPLTTKAARAAAAAIAKSQAAAASPLEAWRTVSGPTDVVSVSTSMTLPVTNGWVTLSSPSDLTRAEDRLRAVFGQAQHYSVGDAKLVSVLLEYTRLSGQTVIVHTNVGLTRLLGQLELDWNKRDTLLSDLEQFLGTNGVALRKQGTDTVRAMTPEQAEKWDHPANSVAVSDAAKAAEKAWLAKHEKPLALLYTYSLIIAIVCGTAGLPHILVRFYTNPDGVAAKRTTMWVMILIGIFYVFPPVFGVMGRNLMPELYNGLTGVKGTDGIVLKLPTILREKYGVLGSILSGVTCAGAFAAFMSTFSGLLVSMTGALAHDVYGRILKPKATAEERLRMFKIAAVLIGGVAIVLGCFVEPLEINFMVGQAFAIAAASYFPLLFMSVWWRGMTMRGAAIGMLTGGLCALAAVTLTNVSNLALDKGPMGKIFAGFAPMNDFWAQHPLLRILCEQPAIWTVPLAIGLMIVMSKATRKDVPSDVRMNMLVLHAPEKLGLKQEYIQEHQHGH